MDDSGIEIKKYTGKRNYHFAKIALVFLIITMIGINILSEMKIGNGYIAIGAIIIVLGGLCLWQIVDKIAKHNSLNTSKIIYKSDLIKEIEGEEKKEVQEYRNNRIADNLIIGCLYLGILVCEYLVKHGHSKDVKFVSIGATFIIISMIWSGTKNILTKKKIEGALRGDQDQRE